MNVLGLRNLLTEMIDKGDSRVAFAEVFFLDHESAGGSPFRWRPLESIEIIKRKGLTICAITDEQEGVILR